MKLGSRVRVLCFGDSNTWGFDPVDGSRYPDSVRWTALLQTMLGDGYQIIEEGLNGRTTVFDYRDRYGKNGKEYLRPAMDSHSPLDLLILYLGTNDTKHEFGNTAAQISDGLEQLIVIAHGQGLDRPSPGVKLIIVAPTLIDERYLSADDRLRGGGAKTRELPALYRALAAKHGASFVDLSNAVPPSVVDGCHLDPDGHRRIAELLFAQVVALAAPPSPNK